MLLIFLSLIIGLILGSYINVFVSRYSSKESSIFGYSRCPHCHHRLFPLDLIPVISWLLLKGNCRYCHKEISIRYPLVELLTACLFAIVSFFTGASIELPINLLIVFCLIVISLVDHDLMIIPDSSIVLLILCGLLLIIIYPKSLIDRFIGFILSGTLFFILAYFSRGLGYGDVKLMAAAGLILGPFKAILAFVLASILGSIPALFELWIMKQSIRKEIPFGPYLSCGIFICLLWGDILLNWYIKLLF